MRPQFSVSETTRKRIKGLWSPYNDSSRPMMSSCRSCRSDSDLYSEGGNISSSRRPGRRFRTEEIPRREYCPFLSSVRRSVTCNNAVNQCQERSKNKVSEQE